MSDVMYIDTSRLENKIERLSAEVRSMSDYVGAVGKTVNRVESELADLRRSFEQMINDQKRTASLQRAATELVRVRQELEQKYGNYRIIRETMLGVLQATDLALVKKNTISRVSEELMLSTPKYWLAPCLVAIAAWIGNDRDLANRAITEAVRRDEERTALTMALICRRNNRPDTCHEWLSLYFSNQNAARFSEGSFVYIDAYINGVFGVDKMHLCDDYVNRWLAEIKGNSAEFEQDQSKIWKNYCAGFTCGVDNNRFAALKQFVPEYPRISGYVERVNAAETIIGNFDNVLSTEANMGVLKERIDKNLIELISRYNDDEQPLRREEAYLLAVKRYDGEEELAKAEIVENERIRMSRAGNIITQMVDAITGNQGVLLSQKKTAISFLGGYISRGITDFVEEKKAAFPEEITVNMDGWMGKSRDGHNVDELKYSYEQQLNGRRTAEINKVQNTKPTSSFVGVGACAAAMILFLFTAAWVLAIPCMIGVGFFAYKLLTYNKVKEKRINEINAQYDTMIHTGKVQIDMCLAQWRDARIVAEKFQNREIKIA